MIKIEDNNNFVTTPPALQKKNPMDNRTGGFHSNIRASLKLAKIPQRDYKNMTGQMFLDKYSQQQRPETYGILS